MHTADLREHLVNGGRVIRSGKLLRLLIPPTGASAYTDAQLDDYAHTLPHTFTNRPPQHLRIRARFSQPALKGTAGFGFWNHPFSRAGSVIAPPCNVWFFYSSAESDLVIARDMPGHGYKASMLNSGQMPAGLMAIAGRVLDVAFKVPLVSSVLMAMARSVVRVRECALNLDMTDWHEYEITWTVGAAIFAVDGKEVLRVPGPPHGALGFAAWVDNYRAVASQRGEYRFAYVAFTQEQWLELVIMDGDE